jgi:hypothetical protein
LERTTWKTVSGRISRQLLLMERISLLMATFLSCPLQWASIIADVLAPCGACILEKSGGYAPFCQLYQSYHECDNICAAYLENQLLGLAAADVAAAIISPLSVMGVVPN